MIHFAKINSNAEVEPCSFEQWITESGGKGTILKETVGDWIVTLSFTGISASDDFLKSGEPGFWEVCDYNKRRRTVMVYDYASEEEATISFFDSVKRIRSGFR
jgi:hypothetical protein